MRFKCKLKAFPRQPLEEADHPNSGMAVALALARHCHSHKTVPLQG